MIRRRISQLLSRNSGRLDKPGMPEATRKAIAYKFIVWSERQPWGPALPGLQEAENRRLAKLLMQELSDKVYRAEFPPHGFGRFTIEGRGLPDDPGLLVRAYLEPELALGTCLTIIVVALHVLESWASTHHNPGSVYRQQAVEGVSRLATGVNEVFADDGVPWRYIEGRLVPAGEPVLQGHVETVLRCLAGDTELHIVDAEYQAALSHLAGGRTKEAITSAGQAVEGMLRLVVKAHRPDKYKPTLTHGDCLNRLQPDPPWPPVVGRLLADINGLRGALGAHSDATKQSGHRAGSAEAQLQVHVATAALEYLVTIRQKAPSPGG